MYLCINCGETFEEYQAGIIEYGSGAVLSKVELFSCPECESTNIKDLETGKIQQS